ncbi:SDR family oxidoreductase [Tessaracoccus lubricantis]|uniref:SDR family oxidoreductase n=1 Tax=Tessaracoccus lubricantis TaxID=545543 RepID=A0ABP9F2I0_9ACTN
MSNTWSVVTGGSTGLGVAFAERLAAEGSDIWLAARSEDQMQEVAARLESQYGVATRISTVDLTHREARAAFIAEVTAAKVGHLVNNAGFAQLGHFADSDPEGTSDMLELNIVALTEMVHAVLPGMLARGRGAIVNVASTAAFQPTPNMAAYAASKAYVLRLSVALWRELKHTGVRVIASCPGATATGFWANGGNDDMMRNRRSPEQVADVTFDALRKHRPFVVDGTLNRAMALATRAVPMGLQTHVAHFITSR